jgi:hypothetical protein
MLALIASGRLAPERPIGRTVTLERSIDALTSMDRFEGVGVTVVAEPRPASAPSPRPSPPGLRGEREESGGAARYGTTSNGRIISCSSWARMWQCHT